MMKKSAMISAIVMTISSLGAMAQQTSQQQGGQGAQQNQQQRQEHFSDEKQKITQRIQDRIGKMQDRLACVQNSPDQKSLRACFPKRDGRRQDGPAGDSGDAGDKQD